MPQNRLNSATIPTEQKNRHTTLLKMTEKPLILQIVLKIGTVYIIVTTWKYMETLYMLTFLSKIKYNELYFGEGQQVIYTIYELLDTRYPAIG